MVERLDRAPPLLLHLEDRVDEQHQAAGEQHGSGDVGALAEPDPLAALDQSQRGDAGRDADREVDEEDPVPADRLCERAAHEQADRAAGHGDERVHADRLRLLPRLGEHRHDHPEDHGRGQRAADALHEASADQHPLALRQGAQQRRRGEHGEPDQEDAALADQVADPAGQQQQSAERDQVGVHHPREVGLREPQIVLDRGQRDVHDRRVEDDHQHPDAQHVQRQPAFAVGLNGHVFELLVFGIATTKTPDPPETHRAIEKQLLDRHAGRAQAGGVGAGVHHSRRRDSGQGVGRQGPAGQVRPDQQLARQWRPPLVAGMERHRGRETAARHQQPVGVGPELASRGRRPTPRRSWRRRTRPSEAPAPRSRPRHTGHPRLRGPHRPLPGRPPSGCHPARRAAS